MNYFKSIEVPNLPRRRVNDIAPYQDLDIADNVSETDMMQIASCIRHSAWLRSFRPAENSYFYVQAIGGIQASLGDNEPFFVSPFVSRFRLLSGAVLTLQRDRITIEGDIGRIILDRLPKKDFVAWEASCFLDLNDVFSPSVRVTLSSWSDTYSCCVSEIGFTSLDHGDIEERRNRIDSSFEERYKSWIDKAISCKERLFQKEWIDAKDKLNIKELGL